VLALNKTSYLNRWVDREPPGSPQPWGVRWILLCAVLTAIVATSGAFTGQERWVIAIHEVGPLSSS
jgi:hypothetical protein